MATALASGIILSFVYTPAIAIQSAISILIGACPCVLSLITPMAVKFGMKKSSEKGVHFKNGKALQSAATPFDTFVFDLNGTLTEGKPTVKKFRIQDKALLSHILALESHSQHPISKAIINFIEKQGVEIPSSLKVTHIDKSHHSGIKARINGEIFMIGNKDMLQANHIRDIATAYNDTNNGNIYIVRGTNVVGQISIIDQLRKDAIVTIKQLISMGKEVHICTGADKSSVEYYLKEIRKTIKTPIKVCTNTVGAEPDKNKAPKESYKEEVSKESYIKKLQRHGRKVVMIGDAENDLTAIARSNFGVAVKSGSGDTLTEKHAGMTLHKGRLFPIVTAFDVAAKTKRNIYQNLFISLSYNSLITLAGAGLFISLGFTMSPGIGISLMVLESTIVLINLLRLESQQPISEPNANISESSKNIDNIKLTSALRHTAINKPSYEGITPSGQGMTFAANMQKTNTFSFSAQNVETPRKASLRNTAM